MLVHNNLRTQFRLLVSIAEEIFEKNIKPSHTSDSYVPIRAVSAIHQQSIGNIYIYIYIFISKENMS